MKNAFYIFALLFVSCNYCEKWDYVPPTDEDIDNIIQTIIYQDSLPVFTGNSKSVPLSVHLRKIKVVNRKKQIINGIEVPFPLNRNIIDMEVLIENKYTTSKPFPKSDSSYLYFQNNILKRYK